MEDKFIEFEHEVIKKIISENERFSKAFEKQYAVANVTSRELTGCGFYTNFEILDKELQLIEIPNIELGETHAEVEGLEFGAGFTLFIRDGFMKLLECYTYGEPWPKKIGSYKLK